MASPLRSRIPVTYPLRAVQFPTVRLNENVSPGRMRRPSTCELARRRLETTTGTMHPHGHWIERGPALRQPRRTSQQLFNPASFELRDVLGQLPRHDRSKSTQFPGYTEKTSAESSWLHRLREELSVGLSESSWLGVGVGGRLTGAGHELAPRALATRVSTSRRASADASHE